MLMALHLILEHLSLLLVVEQVVLRHQILPQVKQVDLVVAVLVVLLLVVVETELVIHSQDLLRLILQLMVGVALVEMAVLDPTVAAAVAALKVMEHQLHQETMVVEVCYSPQHLEIQL